MMSYMFFLNNPSLLAIEGQAGFLDGNPLAAASLLSDTFVDGRNPAKPVDIAFRHSLPKDITVSFRIKDIRIEGTAKPVCSHEYDGC